VPRYFAFLRAINVGGHTVKMDTLRRLFEAVGFANVETFIASGNVIFDAPARKPGRLEQTIEKALAADLGYAVATFLRTPAEVNAIAALQPFPDYDPAAQDGLYVAFLKSGLDGASRRALSAMRSRIDDFHHVGREVYWLRRRRLGESDFTGAKLEKAIHATATMRNMTTIAKLVSKFS